MALAAIVGKFAEDELASTCDHLAAAVPADVVIRADENHSVQPGTCGWEVFGS